MSNPIQVFVIGGGAAGFFGAIRAAEVARRDNIAAQVTLLENSATVLKKVRISGGGRCNVTHHCFDVKTFVKNYPRGSKELISPFQKFQALDTVAWFKQRNVRLVPEEDGRMFPDTDSSETIIQCLMNEVDRLGVRLLTNHAVQAIRTTFDQRLELEILGKESFVADRVLIATGSSSPGYAFAKSLGHSITMLAPSLFSFKIEHSLLTDLSGLSFPKTKLKLTIPDAPLFQQDGPCLITHWGLSGPAILKLSAWAARDMMKSGYKATLHVNWLGLEKREDVLNLLLSLKEQNLKSDIKNVSPEPLPKRFWAKLVALAEIPENLNWAEVSKKQMLKLVELLYACPFEIQGKNRYKDEFVECGGVALKEIDFRSMQSKICPGVYFAGELLDVDGITGGFNFQNAWTTSYIAGGHMINGGQDSQPL